MKTDDHDRSRAPLVVISGPSGVGKTTIVDRLIAAETWPIRRAVTATTRPPRPGERPEVDYHFWSVPRFLQAIENGEMLEHAIVHDRDYYGTPRSEVEPHRERGTGVVLVIDVQGAERIRTLYPDDHLSIFVAPPDFSELETRLRGRRESEESIRRRLATADGEMRQRDKFHHVVVNDDLATTIQRLEDILRSRFT